MELVLRKYFWAFNLAFLALVALLLARTANLFVESAIAPVPSAEVPTGSGRGTAVDVPKPLDLPKLAKITGLPLPAPEPDVVAPNGEALDPNAAPVKSDLHVRLLGTLLAGTAEWSFASIQDLGTQRSGTYRIGDRVLNAELLEIERTRVIVRNNGRREYISNEAGDAPPIPSTVAIRPPDASQTLGSGVRVTGENSYEIPRSEIDRTLGDLSQVAMQARIVPAFKDGAAQGFKLFSIRPDSIYSKIGIVNGDVIKRINGFEMNSPEKALEIYSKLKEANRIDIDIERNGSPLRKQYTVR